MVNNYKFYTNGQWIKVYMLTIYIIHVECDDIMLHHAKSWFAIKCCMQFHFCN
jgi:hypothetical protein